MLYGWEVVFSVKSYSGLSHWLVSTGPSCGSVTLLKVRPTCLTTKPNTRPIAALICLFAPIRNTHTHTHREKGCDARLEYRLVDSGMRG